MLTWPQCPLVKEYVLEHLKKLVPSTYITVSEEAHEDGSPHLHAFLAFAEKFNTRNCKFFNLTGLDENSAYKSWQANIKNTPTRLKAIEYVQKDGNFVEFGKRPINNDQEKVQTRIDAYLSIKQHGLLRSVQNGDIHFTRARLVKNALETLSNEEFFEKF